METTNVQEISKDKSKKKGKTSQRGRSKKKGSSKSKEPFVSIPCLFVYDGRCVGLTRTAEYGSFQPDLGCARAK